MIRAEGDSRGYERAVEAITDSRTRVVSFDVFDTLVARPALEAADLFELTERRLQSMDLTQEFVTPRLRAQAQASRAAARAPSMREEPTLDEIYREFAAITGLSEVRALEVRDIEVDTELRLLAPRRKVLDLVEMAREHGSTIIAVSDTYLPPSIVADILHRAGVGTVDGIFVSSEHGRTKASGSLHDIVLRQMGVRPEELVHIGDNLRSDYEQASERGIRAIHISSAAHGFFSSSPEALVWTLHGGRLPAALRLIVGLIVRERFDDLGAPSRSAAEALGYARVGPMMLLRPEDRVVDSPFALELLECTSEEEAGDEVGDDVIDEVRAGARQFMRDYERVFGELGAVIDPPTRGLHRGLEMLATRPDVSTARLFEGARLPSGEVAIAASSEGSVWKEGYDTLQGGIREGAPVPRLRRAEIRFFDPLLGPTRRLRLRHSPEQAFSEGRLALRLYGWLRQRVFGRGRNTWPA